MSRTRHPFALALLLIALVAALLGFSGLVGNLRRDPVFGSSHQPASGFPISP